MWLLHVNAEFRLVKYTRTLYIYWNINKMSIMNLIMCV